jgi:hypothetical protein
VPKFVFDKAKGCVVDKATGIPDPWPEHFEPPRIYLALDYKAYRCPVSGRPVEGRRAHQENLKRTGCRVLEKGEREQNQRNRADADRRLETKIGDAVEKTAAALNI